MKKNEQFVITINRELGSGGRTVGEKLAEKLGVFFYDKALIQALCKEYNLTVDEVESLKGTKSNWWEDFQRHVVPFYKTAHTQYYRTKEGEEPTLITSASVYKTEKRVLQEIAGKGSCVITGRLGFHVFKDHPNHLSILIQAPLEKRIARVMRKDGVSEEEAKEIIKKVDKMRDNYVQRFADTTRYDTRNYDLVINMQNLTEDAAADIIKEYIDKAE